jgi:hypothetical protein
MFTIDRFNNVGRRCNLNGDHSGYRRWAVRTAVTGTPSDYSRYMVRNLDTGEYRVVATALMSALY